MVNEMEDRPWTKYWIKHYKNDNQFGKMRFKVRKKFSKDLIRIDWEMVDFVEDDEFVKIEPNRLPLFIGSQFGITPRIEKLDGFFNGNKFIAILAKSQLSGHVDGLLIYLILETDKEFKYRMYKRFANEL